MGHDIYLEKTPNHSGFHYHEDGFSWEIFYQTGDDLTLFIPLCDLNKETGGRLLVEHHPKQSVLHPERNSIYTGFAEFCQPYGVTDENGLVSRDAIKASPHRAVMSAEYVRIRRSRLALCAPKPPKMAPVDASAGEVVLFCNKRFHDVEPWRLSIFTCCFWMVSTSTAPMNPVRGFAGSRRQGARNSPNSLTPSHTGLPGIWSARAYWCAMPTTATSPPRAWRPTRIHQ